MLDQPAKPAAETTATRASFSFSTLLIVAIWACVFIAFAALGLRA